MNQQSRNDILWAPWRMEYIKAGKGEEIPKVKVAEGGDINCFICQACADVENDRKR